MAGRQGLRRQDGRATAWPRDPEHIKKPLAEELLFGKLAKGGVVKVGVKDGQIDLRIEGPEHPRLSGKKPPLLTAE